MEGRGMEGGRAMLTAAVMVLGAMALFGFIDNFVRLAAAEGGVWQFHLMRSVLAVGLLVPLALWQGARLAPIRWGRVGIRTFLNSSAMVIYFACLGFMPIAQVVAGLFTAPIWVVIFSALLFGQQVGPRRTVAVAIGFVGILLALGPSAAEGLSLWSVIPVLAGALYGLGNIVTREWCAGEGTFALLGAFFSAMALWGAVGLVVLTLWPLPVAEGGDGFITRGWVVPDGWFLAVIIMQGVGSLIGVGLSIRAYQIADATMVAVMENTLLVFATVWTAVLWREWPTGGELLGLGLILVAGVVIALRTRAPQPIRAGTLPE